MTDATTEQTHDGAASALERAVRRLVGWIWPMCPSGLGHRQVMEMVPNINGNKFCWHPDCIEASKRDVPCRHRYEPQYSVDGKLYEFCKCGAHRIYGRDA